MKVAILSDKTSPEFVGGYEVRVWAIAKLLAERHQVRIYTSSGRPSRSIAGIQLVRVSPVAFGGRTPQRRSLVDGILYSLALMRDPTRDWSPDIFLVEAIPYLHVGLAHRWLRRATAKRVLLVDEAWGAHNYELRLGARVATLLIRQLLRKAVTLSTKVVAVSTRTRKSLEDNFGASNVLVIPSGIDLAAVDSAKPEDLEFRYFDFVLLGRLVPEKRVDDFLRALAVLRDSMGWTGEAVVIGDGPEREHLKGLADSLGVSAQLNFAGQVSDAAKYRTLWQSKVYVLCSSREGYSLSTLEAMASGLPAIVAQPEDDEVFGVSDLVTENDNGLVYPAGNVGRLADEMKALLTNPELRNELGRSSRAKAERRRWDSPTLDLERDLSRILS